jgi:hypothetical protein
MVHMKNLKNLNTSIGSSSNFVEWQRSEVSNAKRGKQEEVPIPDKGPEIIPPGPPPVTWPKKEPEIAPGREPLTTPPSSPPEVPKPPESESGVIHFYNWRADERNY